jgi:regulator of sigma E protease
MDALSLLYFVEMALGIGLVIFVHEAGHFIAARLCKVRVETFSLGFGPRLFGWRRGETLYQVAMLPLGGFCKMAGEEPSGDGLPPARDDLRSKSVGQRFFIYSGGVIMNVIFGLVVFPIILFYGVPFTPPTIGQVAPGQPAWQAGLEPGTQVLSVNGHPTIGFMFIAHEVALGPPEETRLEVLDPGASEPRLVVLEPEYNQELGFSTIGVGPAVDPEHTLKVDEGSVAWEAGLRSGDQLVHVESPLPELPLDEQFILVKDRGNQSGAPMSLTVRRNGKTLTRELVPERPEPEYEMLGVGVLYNQVLGLRDNPALEELGLRVDDRLYAVNGVPILRARDLELALTSSADPVHMVVDRAGRRFEFTGPALDRAAAIALADDIALKLDVDTDRVTITPGSAAAAAGLLDGDRLTHIDGEKVTRWKDIKDHAERGVKMRIDVERLGADGEKERFAVFVEPELLAPAEFGVYLRTAIYTYRAASLGEAVRVGIQGSWKFLADAWMTVKRMLLGQVSGKNMGGIISIGMVSYSWASLGLPKLLFFLCILSLNLAFLNVLPIPVLDGGHLMFLIIEKIKGSPVSERVFGYSQMVGIVLILSLMIYVTYNDLVRWVFEPLGR